MIPLEVARPYDLEASSTGFCTVVVPHCHAGERVVVTLLPGATVSGRVVRAKDGSAVANAKVQLPTRPHELRPASEGAEQTTDADGRFRFSDVDEGEYWVQVFPLADAPPDWIEADVKRGAELDLAITVGAGSVVSGRVVDATTGEPIAGAEVGEGWTFHRFVKTDWNGEFEFKGFAEAGYDDIAVRAKGYGRIARTVRNANGPVAERIEVKLARVRVLRGRVVDSSGAPVDGAYVAAPAYILGARTPNSEDAHQLDWPSTFSAADGRYALDVRPDMQHTLYVRKRGFGVASYEVPGRELAEAEFVLPDVVLEAGAIVRGVVVDERKQPLADQVVSLHGRNGDHEAWASSTTNQAAAGYISERTTRTDDLGRFAFADVAAGTYALLHLRADSHDREPVPITVTAGEKPTPITLVAPTGTMIHGVVLGPEGEPVSANVSIDRVDGAPGVTSADVRTAADGSFTASGLAAGSYVCTAWPMSLFGVKPGEPRYSMAKSEPIDAGGAAITIRVARAELVVGRVLDANGKPVVDCTVCVFDGRDEQTFAITDREGRFEVWLDATRLYELVANCREIGPTDGGGFKWSGPSQATAQVRVPNVRPGGPELEIRLP
ncbi:MAG: carboxypeptidase regulatory-like domain-containing protein [Planctomycetes bacterium]|nr:carboxypeptidase regulatory-like domain-containing protein [Planctomycetota bacterium]